MPGSLFKSRPKSDRRLEWKTLKANFVKVPANKNVKIEIGLGKDLDKFQAEIDKAMLLPDDKADAKTTLAPLVTAANKVKTSIATIQPLVKGSQPMLTFLQGVKTDADWWITTANKAHATGDRLSSWDSDALKLVVPALLKLKPELDKMDLLLKGALTKTAAYDPPLAVTRWVSYSKKVRPNLVKVTMLSKTMKENPAPMVKLLVSMKDDLTSLDWLVRGYSASDFHGLPAVADWGKVLTEAASIHKLLDEQSRKIGGL